jgi:hypothetical protein
MPHRVIGCGFETLHKKFPWNLDKRIGVQKRDFQLNNSVWNFHQCSPAAWYVNRVNKPPCACTQVRTRECRTWKIIKSNMLLLLLTPPFLPPRLKQRWWRLSCGRQRIALCSRRWAESILTTAKKLGLLYYSCPRGSEGEVHENSPSYNTKTGLL